MSFTTNLNEMAREQIITKCKESLRSRINELEATLEVKERKFVEIENSFMNEKNSRMSAESLAQDASQQLEEM